MLLSNKICVLLATEIEALAILKELSKSTQPNLPFPLFVGADLNVLITGMGKTNALRATEWAHAHGANNFISAGICGCINDQLNLFQICFPSFIIDLEGNLEENNTIEIKNSDNLRIGTVDNPLHGGQNRTNFRKHCDLIDMESYAIAHTLQKQKIPLRLIKCISDFCLENGTLEIKKNLPRASLLLRDAIILCINE